MEVNTAFDCANGEAVHLETCSATAVHSSRWVDAAVLGVAMACNLCDTYTNQQLQYEWKIERQDTPLDDACLSENERNSQIEIYRRFLFDESSLRLEEEPAPQHVLVESTSSST